MSDNAVKTEKEERERKGSAVPLPGGAQTEVMRVGGSSKGLLSRLVGRLRAEPWGSAPAVSARPGVQALGGFFSGLSVGGKLLLAGAVMALAGGGFIAVSMLQNRGERGETPNPDLSAIDSTLKVHKRNHDGSRSLSYLADASKGEISWPAASAARPQAKPAAKEASTTQEAPAAEPSPMDALPAQALGSSSIKPQLGASPFASVLNAGGGSSGGGSGQSQAGKGGAGDDALASAGRSPADLAGRKKLTAIGPGRNPGLSRGIGSSARRRMGNAMNQLKFAKAMSGKGAATSAGETGASYGSQGFDNSSVPGASVGGAGLSQGSPGGVSSPGGDSSPSTGGGTIGNGGSEGDSDVAPDVIGKDNTAYQDLLDGAQEKFDQAMMAFIAGLALIAIGVALMVTGIAFKIGLLFVIAGVASLALAVGLYMMGRQMNDTIEKQFGQVDQAALSNAQGDDIGGLLRGRGYDVPKGFDPKGTDCGRDLACYERIFKNRKVDAKKLGLDGSGAPAVKGVER